MLTFIIFILISIGFWLYVTKVNTNFIPDMQDKFIIYIKDVIKKATPASDSMFTSNITLMKMNLYLLTFNKNLEIYNKIYNSNEYSFLSITSGINEKSINLEFSDVSNLLPQGIPFSEDILKSKLELSFKNNSGFSKFFINLCNKGVYLLDYSNILINLLKPILIIKSLKFTQETKINKLNFINSSFEHTPESINTIISNINKIIDVIYNVILISSNITINYKYIIDLNNKINTISNQDYIKQKETIMNKVNDYKNELETYLNNEGFEYSYMKNYINIVFSFNDFVSSQEMTSYIVIYKMLKGIDTYATYDNFINTNILPYMNNINL